MNIRRRYDTVALVSDIKRERRRAIVLSLVGVALGLILLGVYFSSGDSEPIPQVPTDSAPVAEPRAAAKPADAPAETDADAAPTAPTESPAAKEPPAPALASVQVVFPRPLPLWIDEVAVGKVKAHKAELPAGKHKVRMKLGKRNVQQAIDVQAGDKLEVRFDPRKKALVVKKL